MSGPGWTCYLRRHKVIVRFEFLEPSRIFGLRRCLGVTTSFRTRVRRVRLSYSTIYNTPNYIYLCEFMWIYKVHKSDFDFFATSTYIVCVGIVISICIRSLSNERTTLDTLIELLNIKTEYPNFPPPPH